MSFITVSKDTNLSLDHLVIPTHYRNDLESVLIPNGLIIDRVARLAELIARDTDTSLVACCILKVSTIHDQFI